jgi:DNA-binding transcriptional LysR family regulator
VLRRVSALEKHYGVKLFDRDQSGYRPTPTCHAIVEIARSVSHSVAEIEQEILSRHRRLEGRVKLTTTDTIYLCGLEDMIAEFGTLHPDIVIETHVTNAKLDIARYAADIAVRPSRAPPQWLTGRRVSGLSFALYGATAEFADTWLDQRQRATRTHRSSRRQLCARSNDAFERPQARHHAVLHGGCAGRPDAHWLRAARDGYVHLGADGAGPSVAAARSHALRFPGSGTAATKGYHGGPALNPCSGKACSQCRALAMR